MWRGWNIIRVIWFYWLVTLYKHNNILILQRNNILIDFSLSSIIFCTNIYFRCVVKMSSSCVAFSFTKTLYNGEVQCTMGILLYLGNIITNALSRRLLLLWLTKQELLLLWYSHHQEHYIQNFLKTSIVVDTFSVLLWSCNFLSSAS